MRRVGEKCVLSDLKVGQKAKVLKLNQANKAIRRHLLDMLQCGHGLLHGLGDLRFHLFRTGAGIGGHDHDIGEVHVGQQIRGHPCIGYKSEHDHRDYRHEYSKRFFYTERRHTQLLSRKG